MVALACLALLGCTGEIVGPGGSTSADPDGGAVVLPDAGPNDPDARPGAPDAGPQATPLASGIRIGEVAIYQGIKISLAINGSPAPSRPGPVVAGAQSMIGVFVDPESGFQSRQLRAVVTIDGREFYEDKNISGATGDDPNQNGFTVDIPKEVITTSSTFSVELREVSGSGPGGSSDGARYPASADAQMGAQSSNGPLRLVIVPFQYNADGSGRMPRTDSTAMTEYERLFRSMYPVAEVDITVRQAVPYSRTIGSNSGWSTWLDTLVDLRSRDGAADNVYYYGVAAPTSTFSGYCRSGCVLGLGYVPASTNSYLFASVGVSFSDSLGVFTALHEVGHTTGRNHSPCGGVSGADPGYPHSGGRIGVWGYDVSRDELKDPSTYTDVMGYCQNQWISDYTYNAIFERLERVNQSFLRVPDPATYRVGLVDESGAVTWTRTQHLEVRLQGDERRMTLLDERGDELETVTGHYFAYNHLPGGTLMVPVPTTTVQPAAVDVSGVGRMSW